jgi:hypothetical protein
MLAPGVTISSGRVLVTAAPGQASNFFNQGYGFLSTGRLAIDTTAPTGSNYVAGVRRNAAGSIYGTTALDSAGPDIYLGGVRVSTLGQLVYADAASTQFSNGNPITATGAFAVNTT